MARVRQRCGMRSAAWCVAVAMLAASAASADPSGEDLAQRIVARKRASQASRTVILELVDRDGAVRKRRMRSYWKLDPDAKRLIYAVTSPPDMKNDAFLAIDWLDSSRQDDQWIYEEVKRRAVRIGNPRRGEPFLGSDFSLEDLKKEDRVELGEFTWRNLGREAFEGRRYWLLEQTPASPRLARSLGWARAVSHVDPSRWTRRRIRFYDAKGDLLKTFDVTGLQKIDGFWTATRIEALSVDGHRSVLQYRDIDYRTELSDETFTVRTLEQGRLGERPPPPPPQE